MTDLRLVASPETAPTRRVRVRRYSRSCLECGQPYTALTSHGEFCRTQCRKVWNNRRMTRGAEVYDLMMALRHDRETARLLKVWKIMCRVVAIFREEDNGQRAGRRSWRPTREILTEKPYLHAEVMSRNAAGAKRG